MSYKKRSIKTEDLLINLENFRFDPVANQKEAINIMLETMESKMKKLAKDIATNGLNPELFYVIKKDGKEKYIVLDGNRRLTAIKLINNPNIIPLNKLKLKSFFKDLKKTGQGLPKTIDCAVFQRKEDANYKIQLIHTGENQGAGRVPWDAKQTARFIKSQQKNSPRPYIWVVDFMEKNGLHLSKGKATNFERIIDTSYVKTKIGMTFKNKKWHFNKNEKIVLDNLKKIVEEINKPDFNVGEIYTAKERGKFINKVLNKKKSDRKIITKRDGKIIREQYITNRETLIPENFKINISQDKVNLIYNELKKLKVNAYRNAVAVLFRMFLELSVKNFINNKSLKTKHALHQKITIVSNYMKKNKILTEEELKPVQTATLKENRHSVFSTETLNDYVHNLDHIPDSNNLKIAWSNMQKFIQKLWE